MTLATTTSRVEYAGNGSTTAFSVPFYFLANGDLKVYQAGVLKTITTHYTVSGAGNQAGGTVTFLTAPASGDDVVIFRDPALTQATDYPPNDPFPAESHERALDKLTMIAQRLNDKLGQALLLPNDEQFSGSLPDAADRAGRYLTFDEDGNPAVSDQDIQAQADAAVAAAAAALAAKVAAELAQSNAETAEANAETAELNAEAESASASAALASITSAIESLTPTFDQFSGDGAEVDFTLSVVPSSEDVIDVYISGAYQQKSQYSVVGQTLTFSTAPALGVDNVEVKISPSIAFVAPGSEDWGLITAAATATEDYGALV